MLCSCAVVFFERVLHVRCCYKTRRRGKLAPQYMYIYIGKTKTGSQLTRHINLFLADTRDVSKIQTPFMNIRVYIYISVDYWRHTGRPYDTSGPLYQSLSSHIICFQSSGHQLGTHLVKLDYPSSTNQKIQPILSSSPKILIVTTNSLLQAKDMLI
jgi:hypothetical protein